MYIILGAIIAGIVGFPELAHAMDTDYTVYNGFLPLFNSFQRLALITSDANFKSLYAVGIVVSIFIAGAMNAVKALNGKSSGLAWAMPVLAGITVYMAMFSGTGTIHLYDPVLNKTGDIGGVPDGIIAMARVTNSIEVGFVDMISTAGVPGSYDTNAGGIGFSMLSQTGSMQASDPDATSSLGNFVTDCVLFEISRPGTTLTWNEVATTADLWGTTLAKAQNPAVFTQSALLGGSATCTDAYTSLKGYYTSPANMASMKATMCSQAGFDTTAVGLTQCSAIFTSTTTLVAGSGDSPETYLADAETSSMFMDAIKSASPLQASALLANKSQTSGVLSGFTAAANLPYYKAVYTAAMFAFLPVIIIFVPTVKCGAAMSAMFGIFIMLTSWSIADATLNGIMMDYAIGYFQGVAASGKSLYYYLSFPNNATLTMSQFGYMRPMAMLLAGMVTAILTKSASALIAGTGTAMRDIKNKSEQHAGTMTDATGKAAIMNSMMVGMKGLGNYANNDVHDLSRGALVAGAKEGGQSIGYANRMGSPGSAAQVGSQLGGYTGNSDRALADGYASMTDNQQKQKARDSVVKEKEESLYREGMSDSELGAKARVGMVDEKTGASLYNGMSDADIGQKIRKDINERKAQATVGAGQTDQQQQDIARVKASKDMADGNIAVRGNKWLQDNLGVDEKRASEIMQKSAFSSSEAAFAQKRGLAGIVEGASVAGRDPFKMDQDGNVLRMESEGMVTDKNLPQVKKLYEMAGGDPSTVHAGQTYKGSAAPEGKGSFVVDQTANTKNVSTGEGKTLEQKGAFGAAMFTDQGGVEHHLTSGKYTSTGDANGGFMNISGIENGKEVNYTGTGSKLEKDENGVFKSAHMDVATATSKSGRENKATLPASAILADKELFKKLPSELQKALPGFGDKMVDFNYTSAADGKGMGYASVSQGGDSKKQNFAMAQSGWEKVQKAVTRVDEGKRIRKGDDIELGNKKIQEDIDLDVTDKGKRSKIMNETFTGDKWIDERTHISSDTNYRSIDRALDGVKDAKLIMATNAKLHAMGSDQHIEAGMFFSAKMDQNNNLVSWDIKKGGKTAISDLSETITGDRASHYNHEINQHEGFNKTGTVTGDIKRVAMGMGADKETADMFAAAGATFDDVATGVLKYAQPVSGVRADRLSKSEAVRREAKADTRYDAGQAERAEQKIERAADKAEQKAEKAARPPKAPQAEVDPAWHEKNPFAPESTQPQAATVQKTTPPPTVRPGAARSKQTVPKQASRAKQTGPTKSRP